MSGSQVLPISEPAIITPRNNEEMKCIVKAPCGHIFHKSCLLQWIDNTYNRNMYCPNCRVSLINNNNDNNNNNNNNDSFHSINNFDV